MKEISSIPGQEQPPMRERVPTRSNAKVWCEQCGVELPDVYADDVYPLCGLCAEEILQSEVQQ